MTDISKQIFTFLGLPASGKGTQAEIFAAKRDLTIVSIGDLIREKLESGETNDPFIVDIKKRYDEGVPQNDEVVFDLVMDVLEKVEGGIVFDNFPFTSPQINLLQQYLESKALPEPIIIYLNIEPKTVIKRILQRRLCSNCGAIYMGEETSICEKCGGALISRSDDNEDTVKARIEQYLPRIKEMVDFYGKRGRLIEINGEPVVEEVTRAIDEATAKLNLGSAAK